MVKPRAETNAAQIRRSVNVFRSRIGIELDESLDRLGQRWDRAMIKRLKSGSTEPGVRKPPNKPTGFRGGDLARSLTSGVVKEGPVIEGKKLAFGSRMPGRFNYAKVQEEGGVITPKNKKYLAIPLPDAWRGRSSVEPPRFFADAFVQRNPKSGKLFIIKEDGRGGFLFLFLLAKKVTIKPRLGMVDTMRNILKKHQRREIIRALERAGDFAFQGVKA